MNPLRPIKALYGWADSKRASLESKHQRIQGFIDKWRKFWSIVQHYPKVAMALAVLLGGGATAGTYAVVVEEIPSFSRGDPGIFFAPEDKRFELDSAEANTLRVFFQADSPVGEVVIEDVDMGDPILADPVVLQIGGRAAVGSTPAKYLIADTITIDTLKCRTMQVGNGQVINLVLHNNLSDGISLAYVPEAVSRQFIGGGNRAKGMGTSGGAYDRAVITILDEDAKVENITIRNVRTHTGICDLSYFKANTVEILNGYFSSGDGIGEEDLIIDVSVLISRLDSIGNVGTVELDEVLPP